MSTGHWSDYAPGAGWLDRYRYCRICGVVWRNNGQRPLIHNGKKARR